MDDDSENTVPVEIAVVDPKESEDTSSDTVAAVPSNKRSVAAVQSAEPPAKKPRKYMYGNYDRYYGYRIPKDFHDVRLDIFKVHAESLFHDRDVLDIGCNTGLVTMAVGRDFDCRSVVGIDIDKSLIGRARQQLAADRRNADNSATAAYPSNVTFSHGNYVLSDEKLLELETPKFDTILCLSITKWIHLNFGDAGLKLAFRRMFGQLRAGGKLVIEAQDWKSYKRRQKLTPEIAAHYRAIRMQPQQFEAYLLGPEVGFESCYVLEVAAHETKGFRRPIRVFVKAAGSGEGVTASVSDGNDADEV